MNEVATMLAASTPNPGSSGHADPVAFVALALCLILVGAKVGGHVATRWGQPAVLGELLFGMILGNLPLLGIHSFEPIRTDPSIDMLSRLGVILLLFEVGLESTVGQMIGVGASSFVVATLGVIAPFMLGWGVGAVLLPDESVYVHVFLGAALCATSVGITARVFKDLGRSDTAESRVILGAAVIDDVMGLVILAAVTGIIDAANRGGTASVSSIGFIIVKAVLFLVLAIAVGMVLAPRIMRLAAKLQTQGVLLATALSLCLLFSWLASGIGLAAIVGAFAAGLVLEESHFADFVRKGERRLEDLVHPVSSFLVPVFFVLMGMHTDLRSFVQPGVPLLAAVLTVAAIIGKQACSLGVLGRGIDRLTVGIGMIPRGEVGLIFATIGMGLTFQGKPILTEATFSAVVVMVILTTLITPPALKWRLGRIY